MIDPGYGGLGYPPMQDPYNPAFDHTLSEEQRMAAFDAWAGSYYAHGSTLDTLSREPVDVPPSTISSFTQKEKEAMTYPFKTPRPSCICSSFFVTG